MTYSICTFVPSFSLPRLTSWRFFQLCPNPWIGGPYHPWHPGWQPGAGRGGLLPEPARGGRLWRIRQLRRRGGRSRCHQQESSTGVYISVFWIHERLVWIQNRGSLPLTNESGFGFRFGSGSAARCGSGSLFFCYWPSRGQQKTYFFWSFPAFYILMVYLIQFSKIKNPKEVTKQ